jgi:hypothetical protein
VANHALGAANRSGSVDQPTGRLTAQAARLTAAGAQLGSGAARSAAVSPRRAADGDEGGGDWLWSQWGEGRVFSLLCS